MAKLTGKAKEDFLKRMAKGRKKAANKGGAKKSTSKKKGAKKKSSPKKKSAAKSSSAKKTTKKKAAKKTTPAHPVTFFRKGTARAIAVIEVGTNQYYSVYKLSGEDLTAGQVRKDYEAAKGTSAPFLPWTGTAP